ncbi:MAG: DUF192 domain-containing protein [Desulfotomaculales bacterium]
MVLINVSKKAVLARRVRTAASFWTRLAGLIGKPSLPAGEALLLKKCGAVHTCFLRFKIDVAFLDRRGKVLEMVTDLRPYRFPRPVRGACQVVELPAGTLQRTGTLPGDVLTLLVREEGR